MDITDAEKLLAGRMYALSAKHGYCHASDNFLAKDRKCSERTIQRRISKLIKLGAFTVVVERIKEKISKRKLYIGDVPTKLTVPSGNSTEVPPNLTEGTDRIGGTGTDRIGVDSSRVRVVERVIETTIPAGSWTKIILQRYEEYRKTKIASYGKHLKALGELKKVGLSPEDIWLKLLLLENSSDFWKENPPDFVNLAGNLHRIEKSKPKFNKIIIKRL